MNDMKTDIEKVVSKIIVKLITKWEIEDGDGSICHICKDQCWLNQYCLMFSIDGIKTQVGGLSFVVCQSCFDAMNTEEDE